MAHMKRLGCILIVATLVLDLSACGGKTSGSTAKIESQPYSANGVSFDYPKNWQTISSSQLSVQATDWNYLAIVSDGTNGGSLAAVIKLRPQDTVESAVSDAKQFKNSDVQENAVTVAGVPATQLVSTGSTISGDKVTSRTIIFEKNGAVYELNFATKTDKYESESPKFDLVMKTLQL